MRVRMRMLWVWVLRRRFFGVDISKVICFLGYINCFCQGKRGEEDHDANDNLGAGYVRIFGRDSSSIGSDVNII